MIWKEPPVAASASDHWETRLTTAHVERVSTSEACEGQIQRESRWSRRPQDGGCCRRPPQWHLPQRNHQWLVLALATFWDFLTLAEHHLILKMFVMPSTLNLSNWTNWKTWENKFLSSIWCYSQNMESCKGHTEVIQRFSCNYVLLCSGTLIRCCRIQMYNYH